VLVLNTYHELDDAPAVLAHVRRALRPGGRLVVVDRRPRSAGAPVPGEYELAPLEGEAVSARRASRSSNATTRLSIAQAIQTSGG